MNLPLPSGSSPPEKPPGINTICADLRLFAKSSTLFATFSALRLFITNISGSAPASRMAFALSYSQLVPGKTGIKTLGFDVFTAGETRFSAV